jgi:hypothetical protein
VDIFDAHAEVFDYANGRAGRHDTVRRLQRLQGHVRTGIAEASCLAPNWHKLDEFRIEHQGAVVAEYARKVARAKPKRLPAP